MKKNTWKTVLTVVVLLALAAALVVAAVECANGASLANTAWSLLPPVIAIILALITKEAYSALFIGVLVGGLFTCGFAPVATLDTIVNDGLIAAISGNAGIFLFLVLGVLLYIYIGRTGLAMPVKGDQVFSLVAVEGGLPVFVGILFVIGLISSTYSAAGSALTALTTSFTVDILQGTRRYGDERLTRIRKGVHVGMAVGMALVILGFEYLADDSVINLVYKVASYTYGPILGMFAFGMFTRLRIRDGWMPVVAVAAPVLSALVQYWAREAWDYRIGFELLIYNAVFTMAGMLLLAKKNEN